MIFLSSASAVTVTVQPSDEAKVTQLFAEHPVEWVRIDGRAVTEDGIVLVAVLRTCIPRGRGTSSLVKKLQGLRDEIWLQLDVAETSL